MNSSTRPQKIKQISKLKLQLQNIVNNIKALEDIQNKSTRPPVKDIQAVQRHTDEMLSQLEQQPINKYLKALEQRKRRRQNRKRKRKPKTVASSSTIEHTTKPDKSNQTAAVHQATTAQVEKPHQQLNNYNNAQRFLRKFELLKMLHLARGSDREAVRLFAAKFNTMRTVWNSILLDSTPQRTQERKIEDQWNEVFFGASEKLYYGAKPKLGDFLDRRKTWDSYIVKDDKLGSSIPCGWVLPNEEADSRWQQYQQNHV